MDIKQEKLEKKLGKVILPFFINLIYLSSLFQSCSIMAAKKTEKEKEKERRRDFRAKLDLRVDYGTAFDVHTTAYMQNVGHGGVFVRTPNPLEVGAKVELEFTLPETFRTIKAQAKVAWSRKEAESDLFPEGMGLTFIEIQPADQKALSEYVNKLAREYPKDS